MIIILGGTYNYLSGIGKKLQIYYKTQSMLYFNYADIGIIGESSAIVPFMNLVISS
jgi:hypothetical protein